MSSSESRSAVVLELAEAFLDRYRKGERPALKDYIDLNPELAEEIREVFPAMAMLENIAIRDGAPPADDDSTEATAGFRACGQHFPEQLGDYRIIREIGHGGMGVVYEAEQISLGRHVALKVLASHVVRDHKQQQRFEREARAAAKLHHTNIVPVFGVGDHAGTAYYVMQYIQGQGLDAVIDELERMRSNASGNHPAPIAQPGGGPRLRDISATDFAQSLLTGRFDEAVPNSSHTEASVVAGAFVGSLHTNSARSALVGVATEADTGARGRTRTPSANRTGNLAGSVHPKNVAKRAFR